MKKPFRQELFRLNDDGERISALARVPGGSAWYEGHFPENPVLPGIAVLALVKEAILVSENRRNMPVRITRIGRIRFRLPVRPDDEMAVEIRRLQKKNERTYQFIVGLSEEPACTGTFTAEVLKNID